MKLSELFKTPFKLKGGATLNLRGFSKRIVDKEVEGGGEDSILSKTLQEIDEDSEDARYYRNLFNTAEQHSLQELLNGFSSNANFVVVEDSILYRSQSISGGNFYYPIVVKQNDKYYYILTPSGQSVG